LSDIRDVSLHIAAKVAECMIARKQHRIRSAPSNLEDLTAALAAFRYEPKIEEK
jgi:hypothetical protein